MIDLDGAYRLHRLEDSARFTVLAAAAFPDFAARISCFGADWLGRQFATDNARVVGGEPLVLMLEPGTGQVLEIPVNVATFHSEELVHEADAAVAIGFFRDWIAAGGAVPGPGQCVGYRKPLFLGGSDDVTNLELVDFNVYWTVQAQLLAAVRGLPPGTRIGAVTLSNDREDGGR